MNSCAYCLRSLIAAMSSMHLYTLSPKKGPDCHAIVLRKYMDIVMAMRTKYPDAAVMQYLEYVSLNKLKKVRRQTDLQVGIICEDYIDK